MAHLLHVIADLDYGGAQSQLLCHVNAAAERGDRHTVASLRRPGPVGELLREAGAEVVWLRQRFAPDPIVAGRLTRLLRDKTPDAVQTWDLVSGLYLRFARPRCRWVHMVREFAPPGGWRNRAERAILDSATRVIAPDETVAERLAGQGVDRVRVVIAPNVCPPLRGRQETRESARCLLERRLQLGGGGGPLLGVVGRWDRMERGKELAWVADLVRVMHPGARVVIVGAGKLLNHCERFARAAVAPDTICFLGPRSDWGELLGGFDAVWCPSSSSAAPTPLVEAMSAGVPVVAARALGRERLVEEGVTGWLTAWNDRAGWARATERIFSDPKRAREMTLAGVERARSVCSVNRAAAACREALLGASAAC